MELNIFIIILLCCALNIAILFFIKTRTSLVISIISSHFLIIFLFNIYLKNFVNFKELVLGIIIYSMMILFLISNNKFFLSYLKNDVIFTNNISRSLVKFYLPISIITLIITLAIITMVINAPQIRKVIIDKKNNPYEHKNFTPLVTPSHPAHLMVKRFYFDNKSLQNKDENIELKIEKNINQALKNKDSLKDNVVLKRTSDIILIIIAFFGGLLIFSNKKLINLSK